MATQYFLRIRGQVKGPFSSEQIRGQVRRKRIGRHHEVSLDGHQWQRAGDIPELFPPVSKVTASPSGLAESDAESRPESMRTGSPESDELSNEQITSAEQRGPAAAIEEWYYSKGGNKLGPVGRDEIQRWLSAGRLSADDLLWSEKLDNWMPARDLPEFVTVAAPSTTPAQPFDANDPSFWEVFWGTSRGRKVPQAATYKFPNLCRYLSIAEVALRILFVVTLIGQLATGVLYFGVMLNMENWPLAFGALLGSAAGIGILWLLFLSLLASLEVVRVLISIEHNTDQATGDRA